MKIVIDSNIFFSALIKDSATRKIIFNYNGTFLFPEYIFEEFKEHKEEIRIKSGLSNIDFYNLFKGILDKVKIVRNDILRNCREDALKIMGSIDEDDVLYIACALAYSDSIIWSDDKHFKMQNKIKVLNTKEMIDLA